MRILFAGATGALGAAAVPKLATAGHKVFALTRRRDARPALERADATPVVADVLDLDALRANVRNLAVDVVVHAAKAIPKRGPLTYGDMRATNRLHELGTRNLLTIAAEAGAARFIAESVVFVYGYGDRGGDPITEDSPTDLLVTRGCRRIHAAAVSMERQTLDHRGTEPVLLRCGLFYGPRATDRLAAMVRRRAAPLPRGSHGLWPMIYIDDAADAVVAALTSPPGIYNIVDDKPVPPLHFIDALARHLGAPRPISLPGRLMHVAAPYFTTVADTRLPVIATRADLLGWQPRHPTISEGLSAWMAASPPEVQSRRTVV